MNIKTILNAELSRGTGFKNWHGISRENLKKHLVEPFEVEVYGEDKVDAPVKMWVVLKERERYEDGYLIAYNFEDQEWYLVEVLNDGTYYCDTVGGATFFDALNDM